MGLTEDDEEMQSVGIASIIMTGFWQPRHRWQCIAMFFVGLIAYGQHRHDEYWPMWVTVIIFQAMILLADLMFMSGNQYDYDPYYKVSKDLYFSHFRRIRA
eukprot:g591.t1